MTTRPLYAGATLAALATLAAGCPSEGDNRLWLATDGSELKVKLQDQEPRPY